MKINFRASEIDRRIRCPGSKKLEKLVTAIEDKIVTTRGNQLHYAVAKKYVESFGAVSGQLNPEQPLTHNDHWMIDYCVNSSLPIIEHNHAIIVEDELLADFERFTLSGHIDLYSIDADGKIFKGWDWKTGYKFQVMAELNYQVMAYIVLAKMNYPDLEYAEFRIVQPVATIDEGDERVSLVVVSSEEEFQAVIDAFINIIHGILNEENKIQTGEKQCEYCNAKFACPAINKIKENMKMLLNPEELSKVKDLTQTELADLAVDAKILSNVMKEITDSIKYRIESGENFETSDGKQWILSQRNGQYKVNDPVGMFMALKDILGEDDLLQLIDFKITDTKKRIADKLNIPQKSKKEDKETAETVLNSRCGGMFEQGVTNVLTLKD